MDSGHSWNAHNTCTQCGTTTRAYTIHCPGDLDEKDRAEDRKAMNTPTASDGAVAWRKTGMDGPAPWRLLPVPIECIEDTRRGWYGIEYAYPPIDRAKLLGLDFEAIVAAELARHQSHGKWITGANTFARCIAAELRALLGGES